MTYYETLTIVISFIGIIGALLRVVYRMGQLALKVDTMWAFLCRRAVSEAAKEGLAMFSSEGKLTEKARQAMAGLQEELMQFYKENKLLCDTDLFIAMEQKFGDRFLHEICIPNGLTAGACVYVAIKMCKEQAQSTL